MRRGAGEVTTDLWYRSRVRLSIRALLAAGVAALALWWGGTNVAVAVREREPLVIPCADYLAQRPDAHWIRLTGCAPDLDNLAIEVRSETRAGTRVLGTDDVTSVYVPLRPAGVTKGGAHLVVRRADPDVIYLVTHHPDDASYAAVVDRLRDSFGAPVEGLVEPAAAAASDRSGVLDVLNLASDAAVVEQGARPTLVFALVVCLVGLGAAACFAWLVGQRLRRR